MRAMFRKNKISGASKPGLFNALATAFNDYYNRGFVSGISHNGVGEGKVDLPVLWACRNVIADNIAGRPIYVAKRDPDNPSSEGQYEKEHPINVLLDNPSPWMSRNLFWSTLIGNMLVTGNGYALARRDARNGRVSELTIAERDSLNIQNAVRDGEVIYILRLYTEGGHDYTEIETSRRNVVRLHGPGYNARKGESVSPIAYSGFTSLRLARLAQTYQESVYNRGTHQRGFLESSEGGGEADYAKLQELLDDAAGVDKANTTRVIPRGWKYSGANFNTVDLAIIEVMKWTVEDIARLYSIPPHMVGHMSGNTAWGKGIDSLSIGFVQNCLRPNAERLEKALAVTLLEPNEILDGYTIRIDLSGAGFGSEESRMGLAERAVRSKLMTPNMARARYLGLPPIEGGDELQDIAGAPTPEDARGPGASEDEPATEDTIRESRLNGSARLNGNAH